MNPQAPARTRGGRVAVATAVAGTVLIAAGAFWLSFTALADLARRSGIDAGQAWAWPLIVDGIIVVSTVAVVALARQRSALYPWALLAAGALVSVTANAIHAVVAADADVPGVLAASVAAVPPLVLLAITHLTVILTRPASEGATPPLADEDKTAPERGRPELQAVIPEPEPEQAPVRELAARLRAEEGWSNKAIARHLGVHPSTVGRWFARPELTTRDEQETL
ncbi:DUF2637 domain-containing protein [Microbacterium betulae]|uniref:DUF2637 domain-containing protein n=1 Tax=Microbacterium betulae TaxID=2981139 RepID=A0AA97FGA0_9MICO|nr:DUF2637 domain-containing protein [Microbacterium sp. AB]WOF21934.1 DUF2637 domain-containing protein [Microbacterium sp. AB]